MRRVLWWLPGLAVALGAAVATAHGLFEVAVAAGVSEGLAWLWPLITDGLAVVAYAATARLEGKAARYAWTVVVVAAGLSGVAQAVYLAANPAPLPTVGGGPVVRAVGEVPGPIRAAVGAWPAIAAAMAAHLLHLIAGHAGAEGTGPRRDEKAEAVEVPPPGVQPALFTGEGSPGRGSPDEPYSPYGPGGFTDHPAGAIEPVAPGVGAWPGAGVQPARAGAAPARDRAAAVALRLGSRDGAWPSVSALEAEAGVSRGTAATVLRTLRHRPPRLHAVPGPSAPIAATTSAAADEDAVPEDEHREAQDAQDPREGQR